MTREGRLRSAYELVVRSTKLRAPQAMALGSVLNALLRLPRPLFECEDEVSRERLRIDEKWSHPFHPRFTLSLATGVGKTRLAGAIMALLWLSREARTFLLLAPRRAVLRRLDDALNPKFREYIFVDPKLVPEPLVIRSDEIDGPLAIEREMHLLATGPRIYLLTPQLIATSPRFKERQQHAQVSPADVLRSKKDLVVIADETHHFGRTSAAETTAWTSAVRALKPRLEIGLTATARPDDQVLYDYPLRRAIPEGFTKKVQLLVRQFVDEATAPDDVDHATVDYALQRLEIKAAAVRKGSTPPFPDVKPVAVFFAQDIEHAQRIHDWIINTGRLPQEALLLTHSEKAKTEDELERLLGIESMSNPVRAVINVAELTEGWDVTNVYVVAPLRKMASFTGALQSMGRGLRLPAGRQVGEREVDTLDVVCFGRETLQKIIEQATTWSGQSIAPPPGLEVRNYTQTATRLVRVDVPVQRQAALNYFELHVAHREVSLSLEPEALRHLTDMAVQSLELADAHGRVGTEGGAAVRLDRERFLSAAASRALRAMSKYLSDEVHRDPMVALVRRWLDTERPNEPLVRFDPIEVGEAIARLLVRSVETAPPEYAASDGTIQFEAMPFSEQFEEPAASADETQRSVRIEDLPTYSESSEFNHTIPYGGWRNSTHAAYRFDSLPEIRLATMLDHARAIQWWTKNQPRRFRIATPLGGYHPDFLLVERFEGQELIWVLEVKSDVLWQALESEARLKAAAARAWCRLQTERSGRRWSYGVALESDVLRDQSWDALRSKLDVR